MNIDYKVYVSSKIYLHMHCSEFIDEVLEGWDTWLETLSLSDGSDDSSGFAALLKRISGHLLPMIEDALWESSS